MGASKEAPAVKGGGNKADDGLASDVAAFASTLGFGQGSGFDDRDFRPQSKTDNDKKAKKKKENVRRHP